MKLFLLISSLAVVYSRPQYYHSEGSSTVEVERQDVVEIHPEPRTLPKEPSQVDENTKEILKKIAEVNEKHGLTQKKTSPSYFHFPSSYQRSQETSFNNRQGTDFKFPRDPFTNPILDYIEGKNTDPETNNRMPMSGYTTNSQEIVPPGQYIKRKITHQQTVLTPLMNPEYMMQNPFIQSFQPSIPPYYPDNMKPIHESENKLNNDRKSDLERQTIDNVKNIVSNSHLMSPHTTPLIFNPYYGTGYGGYYQNSPQVPFFVPNSNYRAFGPFTSEQFIRPGKQLPPWPLAQYFPIVIKDPVMQMINAVTSMIEYGPQAGAGGGCKNKPTKNKPPVKGSVSSIPSKENNAAQGRNAEDSSKLSLEIVDDHNGNEEVSINNTEESEPTTMLDIEDLRITDGPSQGVEFNINYRRAKQNGNIRKTLIFNSTNSETDLLKHPLIQSIQVSKGQIRASHEQTISPPERDQILHDDELNNEESDKAEEIHVSNDGNKKLFSRDNTGSGIFIHKIKVRKGGVAIAGPGGIATAGSGGTAIVGPNGFAYTQPNSLAIAGSGTKVVAVEPTINLNDVINGNGGNNTKSGILGDHGHGRFPRIGKVVAVGPVIYYNKG